MALPLRWRLLLLFSFLLSFLIILGSAIQVNGEVEEEFHEELLLKPLPDRKLLAHFHFQSRAPPSTSTGRHHHLFPKAISQLVEINITSGGVYLGQVQKFHVKEMELSFTQGRWKYDYWGGFDPISSRIAKPPGVELLAVFDVPRDQVDASWKGLTHALSGLFCASVNFLDSSTMFSAPEWSFRQAPGQLRYGLLPREAVCTENLTPWLKLLPCRDKAGLSALMDRPSIFRGFYHSQRLHLTTIESVPEDINSGIILDQTLTVVLQPNSRISNLAYSSELKFQPSWSLSSIFGRKVSGSCLVAKSSHVYLQLEGSLAVKLNQNDNYYGKENVTSQGLWSTPSFELSVNPDRVYQEEDSRNGKGSSVLYHFSIEKYSDSQPFDLGLTWKVPVIWSCQQAPLHISRFLMGSGNERGAIAILLKSTELNESSSGAYSSHHECKLRVDLFQVVPWYIKVYYHSLKLVVDEKLKEAGDVIERVHISPSTDKISPGVMEMVLNLPCGVKSAALTLEFDKGFLHIDEYPPDANQGFDIPSAAISFPDHRTSMFFPADGSVKKSPILSKYQESSPVLSYTEALLIQVITPDFSMPYNVITITCTIFALYFGSLLNVLRRRVGEEERLLKSKAAKTGQLSQLLSKLSAKLRGKPLDPPQSMSGSSSWINSKLFLKITLVALLAVVWQYYFA